MRAVLALGLMTFIVAGCNRSPPAQVAATGTGNTEKGVCIGTRDIDRTETPDNSTILFYMRDHTVWKNTMNTPCFGLSNEPQGFSYAPTDPGGPTICANLQAIRLNTIGSTCLLGEFSRVPITRKSG